MFPLTAVTAVDLGRRWTVAAQGPTVDGEGRRLLGWLTGRLPADGLHTDGTRPLPDPPAWPQPPLPGWGRVGDED